MTPPKVTFSPHTYPDLTHPNGHLPNDMRAQACWFFYLCAQLAKETIGDSTEHQVILEGDLWMDKRYEQQARTTAMIYGLESPEEFMKFWPYVKAEAKACGLPEPSPEYMRPLRLRLTT